MPEDPELTESRTSVLGRASLLLSAFDESQPVLSLLELTERVGLPKSTVHRFAEQMVALGWLERRLAGYCVGMHMFEVGGLAERRNRLYDAALPHIHELAGRARSAVHLGIRDGHEVVYLATIPCPGAAVPTRPGGRKPAYCTGIGKAMLAWEPEEEILEVISHGLEPRTANTIVNPKLFLEELASIKERGAAFDRGEAYPDIFCVAVPLRSSGRAIGGISLSGPPGQFNPEEMVPLARRTAGAIWHAMFG